MTESSHSRRPRPINHSAFSIITPESAYWAGFFMADGSFKPAKGSFSIAAATKDADHIRKFKEFLKSDHKITVTPAKSGLRNNTGRASIDITSRGIVSDLFSLGITHPGAEREGVVDTLSGNPDFWRGAIDGDGYLGFTHTGDATLTLCGYLPIVIQFLEFAKSIEPKIRIRPHKNGNIWSGIIGNRRAYRIIQALYGDAAVALDRKALKAAEIISKLAGPYSVGRKRKHS